MKKHKNRADASNSDIDTIKPHRKISLTRRVWIYLIVFAFALTFTQILQSKSSSIFFWFTVILPFGALVYALGSLGALRAYTVSESATVEKYENYKYELRFINESILPYPFVEAVVRLPQTNSVRCTERVLKISMAPLVKYTVRHGVKFRYRGTYELGIRYIYAYDFFRIFRVRLDIDSMSPVSVIPRRLYMEDSDLNSISDSADKTKKAPYTFDKLEVSDIREYRPGDGLKSVHWKLSSKSDELMVKDYNTGVTKMTYVFCDLSERYPNFEPTDAKELKKKLTDAAEAESKLKEEADARARREARRKRKKKTNKDPSIKEISDEEIDEFTKRKSAIANDELHGAAAHVKREQTLLEYADRSVSTEALRADSLAAHILSSPADYEDIDELCADGVVEIACAAVMRELREGNSCCLVWFDSRAVEGAFGYILETLEDFEGVFNRFATAPLAKRSDFVTRLTTMVSDTQGVKQIFVTSALDPEAVEAFCEMSTKSVDSLNFGSTEIIFYEPEGKFAFPSERRLYIENCREELSENGLKLSEYKLVGNGLRSI